MSRFAGVFTVRSIEDARWAYRAINDFNDLYSKGVDKEIVGELIADTKRNIRKWNKCDLSVSYCGNGYIKTKIVKDYGIDGFIELVEMPGHIRTESEAERFFKDHLYLHYHPRDYDCTGQSFTGWYKLFKRNGKWFAYHSVNVDV